MGPFVLVVMEHASAWPSHITGADAGCIALRQEPNESHSELLRRTYDRVRAIERMGGVVKTAVLSCRDDASLATLEGRVPLARALLATVLHNDDGQVVLVGRANAHDRAKRSLMALAGTLTEALVGTSASVSARFNEAVPTTSAHPKRRADERRSAA